MVKGLRFGKAENEASSETICKVKCQSAKEFSSNSFNFLQNKVLSDCTISAEGKFIYGHRVILASSSLYFQVSSVVEHCDLVDKSIYFSQKLFTTGPKDATADVIHFKDISYLNLCLIMKYAYTGEVSLAENRIESFLQAAKSLQMFGLTEQPVQYRKKKKKRSANVQSSTATLQVTPERNQWPQYKEASTTVQQQNTDKTQIIIEPSAEEVAKESRKRKSVSFGDQLDSVSSFFPILKRTRTSNEPIEKRCQHCSISLGSISDAAIDQHEMYCNMNPALQLSPSLLSSTDSESLSEDPDSSGSEHDMSFS